MKSLLPTALTLALLLAAGPSHAARPAGSKLRRISPPPTQVVPPAAVVIAEVPEVEPNNTREQAQAFACGSMLRPAAIDPSGDADFVKFTVAPGRWIVARTGDDPNAGGPQAGDPMLTLYDGAGTEVAFNDDWGADYHSRITYRSTMGGTYYLKVTGYDESIAGAYEMSVDCQDQLPPANDACAGAQWIECGPIAVQGDNTFANDDLRLSLAGCSDYGDPAYSSGGDVVYAIQATGGDVLDVTCSSLGIMLLYVTDACGAPVGNCLGQSSEGWWNGPAELQVSFGQSGVYYLVVDSIYPGYGGEFNLTGSLDCRVVPTHDTSWGSLKSYYR